ncbi:hypothetical protein [Thermus caldifontis]|uniref:hypothetical protein n=1 Tax=Thermus caldifontis TaxID=1930763 RepID=UPI000DF3546E|nr:hypothetical protein [Thermus caldifontis]
MKKGSKVHEILAELASEGRLLTLEAQDLLRVQQKGQALLYGEAELKAYLQEVRRVREALYALSVRCKAPLGALRPHGKG